jgi:hypothetical protein
MSEHDGATDRDSVPVEWRRLNAERVRPPLLRRVPYVECKLEHPTIEPTGVDEGFFPDAVPYPLEGSDRVFYWRPALTADSAIGGPWELACATTVALGGRTSLPAQPPAVTAAEEGGVSLVVDGTVGGDSTTVSLESYAAPAVELAAVSDAALDLVIDDRRERVGVGDRRRIRLAEQTVRPLAADREPTTVRPELVVRYPGRRELHHPAPAADYRLFPSFGLDLTTVPRPLSVPTAAGELDDDALAACLGVDLAERPYPERLLWQAFAYTAFDPHSNRVPELTQLRTGHLVLATPE